MADPDPSTNPEEGEGSKSTDVEAIPTSNFQAGKNKKGINKKQRDVDVEETDADLNATLIGEPTERLAFSNISLKDQIEAGPSGMSSTKSSRVCSPARFTTSDNVVYVGTIEETMKESEAHRLSLRKQKKKRRREEEDSPEKEIDKGTNLPTTKDSLGEMVILSATNIVSRAIECVATIDDLRIRSSKLQGTVGGRMKNNLILIKWAITILTSRANAVEDTSHLQYKSGEQAIELHDIVALSRLRIRDRVATVCNNKYNSLMKQL